MASLKAIRRRIASVKTTQQITRAMKLVAASRLRRAQDALSAARPYSQALARVADSLLTSEGINIAPPEGARKAALIAVIASDRGLCGGYNRICCARPRSRCGLPNAKDSRPATSPSGKKRSIISDAPRRR